MTIGEAVWPWEGSEGGIRGSVSWTLRPNRLEQEGEILGGGAIFDEESVGDVSFGLAARFEGVRFFEGLSSRG